MDDSGGDTAEAPDERENRYLRTLFLDALAHELRGPSGVTLGALDEMELALGDMGKEHARLFAMARRGIRRVLRTADRLSRSSQLEQGGLSLARRATDINALVERCARDAELVEGRRGVTTDIKPAESAPQLDVDAEWLAAAITELCGYALRSARRAVMIEVSDTPEAVRVVVCDDGAGSSVPRLRRFEANGDRRDASLAYPMIHDVVSAHGGALNVRPGDKAGLLSVLSLPKR